MKKQAITDKDLKNIKNYALKISSNSKVEHKFNVLIDGVSQNYYEQFVFIAWYDYFVTLIKTKKHFPNIVVKEFDASNLSFEQKLEMLQVLFRYFIDNDIMDNKVRMCLLKIFRFYIPTLIQEPIHFFASLEEEIENDFIDFEISEATLEQTALFFYYLFKYAKVNSHNTSTGKVISFFTKFSDETIRQQFSKLHNKALHSFTEFEKDMKVIRHLFQIMDLTEITKMIDNDVFSMEKKAEKKL